MKSETRRIRRHSGTTPFVLLLSSLFLLVVTAITGCSGGPSDVQILNDWEQYATSSKGCKNNVRFTGQQVVGRSTEGNKVTVLLEVTGDWIGRGDPHYFSGPCHGFKGRNGSHQKVINKAVYKKYDSTWRIEKSFLGSPFTLAN